MNKQKLFFLGLAALLVAGGAFPPSAFALTYTIDRPPDGPSPLTYSVDLEGDYEGNCSGMLVGTWAVGEVNGLWRGPILPSSTFTDAGSVALAPGEYDQTTIWCDPDELDQSQGPGIGGGYTITAPAAATGAITIPTGTASTFLANLSSQLGDSGTLSVLVLAISLTLVFWIIKKIVDIYKWDDEKDREIEARAERAMRRTDELLGKK